MAINQVGPWLSRDTVLAFSGRRVDGLRPNRPTCDIQSAVRDVVTQLGLHRRGRRAGNHLRCHLPARRTLSTFVGCTTQPGEIPTIIGNRLVNNNQLFGDYSCERSSVIERIHLRGPLDNIRLGLFNACSIRNKSASIQQWIIDKKINMAALVETHHDDASSPQLIACTPPEFKFVEKAQLLQLSASRPPTSYARAAKARSWARWKAPFP